MTWPLSRLLHRLNYMEANGVYDTTTIDGIRADAVDLLRRAYALEQTKDIRS